MHLALLWCILQSLFLISASPAGFLLVLRVSYFSHYEASDSALRGCRAGFGLGYVLCSRQPRDSVPQLTFAKQRRLRTTLVFRTESRSPPQASWSAHCPPTRHTDMSRRQTRAPPTHLLFAMRQTSHPRRRTGSKCDAMRLCSPCAISLGA